MQDRHTSTSPGSIASGNDRTSNEQPSKRDPVYSIRISYTLYRNYVSTPSYDPVLMPSSAGIPSCRAAPSAGFPSGGVDPADTVLSAI